MSSVLALSSTMRPPVIGPITEVLGDIVCREGPIPPLVSELGDDICGNQGQLIALPFLSLQGISIACDVHVTLTAQSRDALFPPLFPGGGDPDTVNELNVLRSIS